MNKPKMDECKVAKALDVIPVLTAKVKQDISLLFLDVDGVLNIPNGNKVISLSTRHIEILDTILSCSDIDCKICISSAWRKFSSAMSYLKRTLRNVLHLNTDDIIIGCTPDLSKSSYNLNNQQIRISEIQNYLQNNNALNTKYNVVSYCVIDDMDLSAMSNFVYIDPTKGITLYNAHQVICILTESPFDKLEIEKKMNLLKLKPKVKLMFMVGAMDGQKYSPKHLERLNIIVRKTKCEVVNDLNEMSKIMDYVSDMKCKYVVKSWCVLDLNDLYSQLSNIHQSMSSHFVRVTNKEGLVLHDVMNAVSILNKWSY